MIEHTDAAPATPRPRTQLVSVAEAACLLGTHRETIRRRLLSGQLDGVREVRAQGAVWRVRLPVEVGAQAARAGRTAPRAQVHQESDAASDAAPAQDAQAAPAQADSAALVTLLALAGQLDQVRADAAEARRAADQRSAEVADLREERGCLTAELERAASAVIAAEGALSASDAALAAQTRRARCLAWLVAVLAVLVLVAGGLLLQLVGAVAVNWRL